jgi:hypothetical protein
MHRLVDGERAMLKIKRDFAPKCARAHTRRQEKHSISNASSASTNSNANSDERRVSNVDEKRAHVHALNNNVACWYSRANLVGILKRPTRHLRARTTAERELFV